MEFKQSTRKNKKYMVRYNTNSKWIHFGDLNYQQYTDKTPLKLYAYLDHKDKQRRDAYLKRAMGIHDKNGNLTYNNKNSPNYLSIKYLW